jgi:KDO2-lipid IV(A) lauroyltransferase
MGRFLDRLVYWVVRCVVCFVQMLTPRACERLADRLAWLTFDVLGVRRKITLENLAHAFPEKSDEERLELARNMWRHLTLLACEIAHLPRKVHRWNWRDHVEVVDEYLLSEPILDGRPVILASAHFGNFELAGYVLGLLGYATHSVARPLDNPFLHDYINDIRARTGQTLIPKRGGFDWITDVLDTGGTLALLADQFAGPRGCWVDFFNRPASTHKAIALLAAQHEAVLVVGYTVRVGGMLQYKMVVQSRLDPRESPAELSDITAATQWYTSELERFIRQAPEQYWWLHRRWKGEPPARRKKKAKSAAA